MADADATASDPERVLRLRLEALRRAGYGEETAADLAARPEVALPTALSLVKQGFPPEVAYEMLRSGARPVF